MRGNKLHVDETKRDRQRDTQMAKGGKVHMAKPQAAGPAKGGTTGKVQTAAPGARAAKGGEKKMAPYTPAKPAKPGATSPR